MRVLFTLALAATPAAAQSYVAPTDAKAPADELKSFKLPPGFAAQLVASEPDIGKPIQIAFDARGRLWATTSRHYPFPAEGTPSDKLYVLSDIGLDGKAKKVTVFADDLNIPIGILPLPDCKSCLVSHVGSILKLTDTDGDGQADQRETILTGFGTKDTHGMMNSFVLLPDGWVYACHGYLNESKVTAKDGSTVTMHSGNTFRFRPDGSRVEPWTFGQVNPFGMTADPWLNLYTADCHSMPITQLIRGATYQSFAKPDDGLGFAPHVTRHDHGSTALCGLAWYEADHFPKEWSGCLFLGNVVTNRVNADRVEWKGSTPVAKELPDFLTSSDPWFRPTDIKLGPDGALYVADFYNKIIGHYEVDLKHPGRDKDRGRIWRIVWQGEDGKAKPPMMPDVAQTNDKELPSYAADQNLTVRLAGITEIIRRDTQAGAGRTWTFPTDDAGARFYRALGSQLLTGYRYGSPGRDRLISASVHLRPGQEGVNKSYFVFVQELRVAAASPSLSAKLRGDVLTLLNSDAPFVQRAAIDTLIAHPHPDNIAPLVKLIRECPKDDTHLRFAARVALRNALRDADGWTAAKDADPAIIADVALGVPTPAAATFLLGRLDASFDPKVCEHVARYGTDAQTTAVVERLAAERANVPAAVRGMQAAARGVAARGAKLSADAEVEADAVCCDGLRSADPGTVTAAAELAGQLKLASQVNRLAKLGGRPGPARSAALAALMILDPAKAAGPVSAVLADPTAPAPDREKAAQSLGSANTPAARAALVAALPTAPARLAAVIAAVLPSSAEGAVALLDAVAAGKASPQLLQSGFAPARIKSIDNGRLVPRMTELTKGLPSPDAKLAELLKARAAGFAKAKPDAEAGKQVFAKNCAACHQLGGQGAKVGPQLDGVGNRGAERLLEDVLDPNRNVDVAFRAMVLDLTDGRTVTGLLLREEGQVLVVADGAGKEVRVPAADVEKRTVGPLSPMPANLGETLTEAECYALVKYLLNQRAK